MVSANNDIETIGEVDTGKQSDLMPDLIYETAPEQECIVTLKKGETIWGIVDNMLKDAYGDNNVSDQLILKIVKQVLPDNGLDEESAKKLPEGYKF